MNGFKLVHTHTHDGVVVQIWAKQEQPKLEVLPQKEIEAELVDEDIPAEEMK
jgi:hypothetical protein